MPAETRGDWRRKSQSSMKRKELPSSHVPTNGVSQDHPYKKREEREFVVDSGASTHMLISTDLELCRVGHRKGLEKSEDGCYNQRRSANKSRSDSMSKKKRQ